MGVWVCLQNAVVAAANSHINNYSKNIISLQPVGPLSSVGPWASAPWSPCINAPLRTGFVFIFFSFFLALDFWCLFMGIVVHQLWSFAFSRERLRARMWEWHVRFFFLSNWDGAPLGVGALCKLRTLRIGSGGTDNNNNNKKVSW